MGMQRLSDKKKAWVPIRGSENSSAWTRYGFVGMWGRPGQE